VTVHSKSTGNASDHQLIEQTMVDMFRRLDMNGDGRISRQELAAVFEMLEAGSQLDLDMVMRQIDTANDGFIDYVEFSAWLMQGSPEAERVSHAQPQQGFETSQERLTLCTTELRLAETAAAPPKLLIVEFSRDELPGLQYGKGADRRSNVVVAVHAHSPAERAGVEVGSRITEVAGKPATGTSYIPDMFMEAGIRHSKFPVGFVTAEAFTVQQEAEDALPRFMAAVDLARVACENAQPPYRPKLESQLSDQLERKDNELVMKQDDATGVPCATEALAIFQASAQDKYAPTYEQLLEVVQGPKDPEREELWNPYEVLGLLPVATQAEIKQAFMELARTYHPDKFPEEPQTARFRFDRIKRAYDELRTEEVRARSDRRMGVSDVLTAYYAAPDPVQRRKLVEQMVRPPAQLAIEDDRPSAGSHVDVELRDGGMVVVKYYRYMLPFAVPDGQLAASEIDNVYGLSETMKGCKLGLAEWRAGDGHLVHAGDSDTGESPLLKEEKGVFMGLEAGRTYFLVAYQSEESARRDAAAAAQWRREREAERRAAEPHCCRAMQVPHSLTVSCDIAGVCAKTTGTFYLDKSLNMRPRYRNEEGACILCRARWIVTVSDESKGIFQVDSNATVPPEDVWLDADGDQSKYVSIRHAGGKVCCVCIPSTLPE